MMLKPRTLASLTLAALFATAHAPPAMAAAKAAKKGASAAKAAAGPGEAKRLFAEGQRLFGRGDYEAARRSFERAHKLAGSGSALKMVAECNFKQGNYGEAYSQYEQVASPSVNATKAEKADAQRMLKLLESLTGFVDVTGADGGVELFVDGRSAGKTPLAGPLRVAAGAHRIRADVEGSTLGETEAKVEAGQTATIPFAVLSSGVSPDTELSGAAPAAQGAAKGKIRVSTVPAEASILIDGEELGTGKYDGEIAAGPHRLAVVRIGYKTEAREVTIKPGQTWDENVTLDTDSDAPADKPMDAPTRSSYRGMYVSAMLFGGLPVVGATRLPQPDGGTAAASIQVGGGAFLRGGYAFGSGLIAVEGALAFLGDRQTEARQFDGTVDPATADFQNGNILRNETYLVYSMGGFAGVGPRVTTPGRRVRVSVGLTPGIALRHFTVQRRVAGGIADTSTTSATATNPTVVGDAEVLLGASPGIKIAIGLMAWAEVAGRTETPGGDRPVATPDGNGTATLPTPALPVQNGLQLYVGPQIGVRFGH